MNSEKIIEKIMKKAKAIEKVEINQENLIELGLEAFYDTYKKEKGDLYYKDNKIYKKAQKGWYMVKIGIDLNELDQRIKDLVKWANRMKSYMDNKFDELDKKIEKLKKKK